MEAILLHTCIADSDFRHTRRTLFAVTVMLLLLVWVVLGAGCARERMQVKRFMTSAVPAPPPPPPPPPPPTPTPVAPPETVVAEEVPAIWPVAHYTRISSTFNQRRGKGRSHKGIDMEAPPGTPVVATAAGVIKSCGRCGAYGNVIVIDHGNGYETAYAHLKECLGNKDERVQRGQEIGKVGTTGNATAPHLHYEVHENGVPVDPKPWLP